MNASQRLVCPGLLPCDRAQMGGVKQSGQRKSPEAETRGLKVAVRFLDAPSQAEI